MKFLSARAGAAGLLFSPILRARVARAAPAPRLVLFYFPNGPAKDPLNTFFPGPNRDWSGRTTAPLGARSQVLGTTYSEHISLVKPLILNQGWGFGDRGEKQKVGQHTNGMAVLFTGAEPRWVSNNHTASQSKSIDEHIVQGGASRLYVAENPSDTREYRISWADANRPNNPIRDAAQAYAEILPALKMTCAGGGTPTPSGGPTRAQRELQLILDTLNPEIKSAKRTLGLGKEELAKFEAYEQSMVEIEARLKASLDTTTTVPAATASCMGNQPPPLGTAANSKAGRVTLLTKVLGLAVALGGHRVGLLQLDHGYLDANYNFLPGVNGTRHHSMQHNKQTAECAAITRWHMERFCGLLDELGSYKEGTGTVLDNSVVVAGSDVPSGETHDYAEPHVMLLAGGGAGKLKAWR